MMKLQLNEMPITHWQQSSIRAYSKTYLFSSWSWKPFSLASRGKVAFFIVSLVLGLRASLESVVSILTVKLLSSKCFNLTIPSRPASSLLNTRRWTTNARQERKNIDVTCGHHHHICVFRRVQLTYINYHRQRKWSVRWHATNYHVQLIHTRVSTSQRTRAEKDFHPKLIAGVYGHVKLEICFL